MAFDGCGTYDPEGHEIPRLRGHPPDAARRSHHTLAALKPRPPLAHASLQLRGPDGRRTLPVDRDVGLPRLAALANLWELKPR